MNNCLPPKLPDNEPFLVCSPSPADILGPDNQVLASGEAYLRSDGTGGFRHCGTTPPDTTERDASFLRFETLDPLPLASFSFCLRLPDGHSHFEVPQDVVNKLAEQGAAP